MATAREIIKQWFTNFKKPTQEQFWAWLDSYWHKNDKIPMSSVQNLEQSLQNVVTADQFNNHVNDGNAHKALFDSKVDKEDGKGLISDAEREQIQINKNKRVVGHTITGDVNKVSTLILGDGSVIQADFTDVAPVGPDVMLNSLNFNKDTGVLTGVRSDGQQITVDLNGRFTLLNHTHAWNDITGTENVATTNFVEQKINDINVGGRNLIIKSRFKKGYIHNGNVLSSGVDYVDDTFYELKGRNLFFTVYAPKKSNIASGTSSAISFYDGNKRFIKSESLIAGAGTISKRVPIPVNAMFFRYFLHYKEMECKLEYGNIGTYNTPAPEDIEAQINTTILKTSANVSTSQYIDGFSQNGRTIITQGTANIVITADSADGFVASYQKVGTGNITFQAGSGKNLVQVDGTNVVDGAKGSTATITIVGNEVLLRISNV